MTALDLFHHLQAQGVRLTPAPDGTLRYRAVKGVLTPALVALMRQHKTALHDLVEAYEERLALAACPDAGAPDHAPPPMVEAPLAFSPDSTPVAEPGGVASPTDVRSLRQWVTGLVPDTAQLPMTAPLPAPRYHDSPSAPATYWGEVCTVKACQKADTPATQSLRYAPSGTCVACWERWDKRVTREEAPDV